MPPMERGQTLPLGPILSRSLKLCPPSPVMHQTDEYDVIAAIQNQTFEHGDQPTEIQISLDTRDSRRNVRSSTNFD